MTFIRERSYYAKSISTHYRDTTCANDQYEVSIKQIENNTELTEEQRDDYIDRIDKNMEMMAGIQRIMMT